MLDWIKGAPLAGHLAFGRHESGLIWRLKKKRRGRNHKKTLRRGGSPGDREVSQGEGL